MTDIERMIHKNLASNMPEVDLRDTCRELFKSSNDNPKDLSIWVIYDDEWCNRYSYEY
jgi:hypothetical protein